MNLEYRTGYCNNCKTDHKLERQKPNNLLHFLIAVVLGIFTNGIGSVIWIVIWYLITVKFSVWSCHVCGSRDCKISTIEYPIRKKEHSSSANSKFSMPKNTQSISMENLKKPILIIGSFIIVGIVIFLLFPTIDENKKDENNEEKNVNVTVEINEKDSEKKEEKSDSEYETVENDICKVKQIKTDLNSVSGLMSCKKGKLTIHFYDRKSNSIVARKTISFDDNKFYTEYETPEQSYIKFSISLLKDQITDRLYQIKEQQNKIIEEQKKIKEQKGHSIQSVEPNNNEITKCSLENWKYSKYSNEYLLIDGKATCKNGQIILQIYDENNNYLGKESAYIEARTFKVYLKNNSNPTNITIKYTIVK